MTRFNVKFADAVFAVSTENDSIIKQFEGFITGEAAQLPIEPSEADLAKMRVNYAQKLKNPQNVPRYAELGAIHLTAARLLLKRGYLLTHGSAVVVDGGAYLFLAPSGTGKSTHTRLWLELLGGRAYIINDDKPILSPQDGAVMIYPTPWGMVGNPTDGAPVPLKALVRLERGEENKVWSVSESQMFIELFKASLQGDNAAEATAVFELEKQILSSTPLYRMTCTPTLEAAKTAYEAIVKTNDN